MTTLLSGQNGRVWQTGDPSALGPEVAVLLAERETALTALGFARVGDLTCSTRPETVLRGYAEPNGDTWCVVHVSPRGGGGVELFCWLGAEGGASLLTTQVPVVKDNPRKKRFRTPVPDGSPAELLNRHRSRMGELARRHGLGVPVVPELSRFAETYESCLQHELWG